MKNTIKFSRQATLKANEQGLLHASAYILLRQLHCKYKHPIILNYNANRTSIRQELGYSDKKFRELINYAISVNMASYEGKHLVFLSNNKDRHSHTENFNSYVRTSNVKETFERIIVRTYYYKQKATISDKKNRTASSKSHNGDFDYQKRIAPQTKKNVNEDITLSCRSLAKLLNRNSPAYGFNKRKKLANAGFINLHENKVAIHKEEAIELIKNGHYNIRRDKETDTWFYILAHTFDLGNKRKESYCQKGTLYTDR